MFDDCNHPAGHSPTSQPARGPPWSDASHHPPTPQPTTEAVAVRSTQTDARGRRRENGQIRSLASSSNFATSTATGRRSSSGVERRGSEIYFPFSSLYSTRSTFHPSPIRLPKHWHHLPAKWAIGVGKHPGTFNFPFCTSQPGRDPGHEPPKYTPADRERESNATRLRLLLDYLGSTNPDHGCSDHYQRSASDRAGSKQTAEASNTRASAPQSPSPSHQFSNDRWSHRK